MYFVECVLARWCLVVSPDRSSPKGWADAGVGIGIGWGRGIPLIENNININI